MFTSVQFSLSVMSNSLLPHGLQHARLSCKINVHLTDNPAILILGIYLREIKICVHIKTITWMYIAGFFKFIYFNWRLITLQYCSAFCHTLTWISRGCTCVPHPEPHSNFPPHPIPQGHPSAPALSTLSHASNLDWWSVSHMVIHMCQCYSLKSSHPCLLPQSPKVCSLHLCLFCYLRYRVIVTIFLNATYMH